MVALAGQDWLKTPKEEDILLLFSLRNLSGSDSKTDTWWTSQFSENIVVSVLSLCRLGVFGVGCFDFTCVCLFLWGFFVCWWGLLVFWFLFLKLLASIVKNLKHHQVCCFSRLCQAGFREAWSLWCCPKKQSCPAAIQILCVGSSVCGLCNEPY